jgi:signal transduction histidine kinase
VIWPFSYILPDETETAPRNLTLSGDRTRPFLERLDGLRYNVYINHYNDIYRVSIGLGHFMHYFRTGFLILLIIELLTLITRSVKDAWMIRRTLAPISELAKAAQSLNTEGSQFDPNKMAAIAGKLEGINAAGLDTRIQVDGTQEELKNLARALNGMLDRINESNRAPGRFVSDASHELRTPISVIQGYASLLDRWGKNDEKTLQESINAIKDEAANMKDLVEQLLILARGDNNTITLQLERLQLPELAEEVVHETQMIDSTHHISVRASDAEIDADRGLIKQACAYWWTTR